MEAAFVERDIPRAQAYPQIALQQSWESFSPIIRKLFRIDNL
jgi:hypothetical protein